MNPPRQLSRRWWLGTAVAATAAGLGLGAWRLRSTHVSDPALQAFWASRFETPDGQSLDMAAWRGRPLLVNFWATWCPPCIEELPLINAFWQQHQGQGLGVIGLAVDQTPRVLRYLKDHPLGFAIGMAGMEGTQLAKSLGNQAEALPFSVFFKADGHIYKQKLGKISQDDLEDWRQHGA